MRPEGEIRTAAEAISKELEASLDMIAGLSHGPGVSAELQATRDSLSAMNAVFERVLYLTSQRNAEEAKGARAAIDYISGEENQISDLVRLRGDQANG